MDPAAAPALLAGKEFGAILVAIFFSLTFLPRSIYSYSNSAEYVPGIAGSWFSVKTYAVVILTSWAYLIVRKGILPSLVSHLPFIALSLTFMVLAWPHLLNLYAGMFHISIAILALALGRLLGSGLSGCVENSRLFAKLALFFTLVQLPIVLAQRRGLPVFPMDPVTELVEGARANGSFAHPSTLGKVLIVLLLILLPLSRSLDRRTRRDSIIAIALSVPLYVATESRANFAGLLLAVIVWATLTPGARWFTQRLLICVSSVVAVIVTVPIWLYRNQTGSTSEFRSHLLEVGLQQLRLRPWFGTGPNNYIQVVRNFDVTASWGLPVHNTFVLSAAELGIPLAVLFFLPLISMLSDAASRCRLPEVSGDFARAHLAVFIGLLSVTMTGWGMLGDLLPLWFLMCGMSSSNFPRGLYPNRSVSPAKSREPSASGVT